MRPAFCPAHARWAGSEAKLAYRKIIRTVVPVASFCHLRLCFTPAVSSAAGTASRPCDYSQNTLRALRPILRKGRFRGLLRRTSSLANSPRSLIRLSASPVNRLQRYSRWICTILPCHCRPRTQWYPKARRLYADSRCPHVCRVGNFAIRQQWLCARRTTSTLWKSHTRPISATSHPSS